MAEAVVKLGDGNWATKEGKLLAHKQVGGRYLNTEFDVTRGTDATYVGRDGLIKQMSEASVELIQNGDFSELGTEEVTDPGFLTNSLSDWTIAQTDGVYRADTSYDLSGFMRLTYKVLASGLAMGAALLTTSLGHAEDKWYKVVMRVRGTKADGVTAQGSAFSGVGENTFVGTVVNNPTLTSEWQDYEFYAYSNGSNFRLYLASAAVGDLVDFDSISIKQIDPNARWIEDTGNVTLSYTDFEGRTNVAKVVMDTAHQASNRIKQVFTYVNGSTYRVECNVWVDTGTFRADATDLYMSDEVTTTVTGEWIKIVKYVDAVGNGSDFWFLRQDGSTYNDIFYVDSFSVKKVTDVVGDVPRIDFLNNPQGHLLLEPVRTNELEFSQTFNQATSGTQHGYIAYQSPSFQDLILAPDGTTTGHSFTGSGSGSIGYYTQDSGSATADKSYVMSVFVKAVTGAPTIKIGSDTTVFDSDDSDGDGDKQASVLFNPTTGVISGAAEGVRSSLSEDYGNGWWRVTIATFPKNNSASGNFSFVLYKNDNTTNTTIAIWGAQLEKDAIYGTSYIPTNGVAVTRSLETCNNAGAAEDFDSDGGVLYVEMAALGWSLAQYQKIYLQNTSNADNNIQIRIAGNVEDHVQYLIYTDREGGGTNMYSYLHGQSVVDTGVFHKYALRYSSTVTTAFYDGSEVDEETSPAGGQSPGWSGNASLTNPLPLGPLNRLQMTIGQDGPGLKIKAIRVYKEALSDADIIALTS